MIRPVSLPLILLSATLGGCHLVDQRDFDPNAGQRPTRLVVPTPVAPPLAALVTIGFTTPPPAYGAVLASAVGRALAAKPDALFVIETGCGTAMDPGACIAAGADVAAALEASGALRGQVEQSLVLEPARRVAEVRVFVR